ncbi:UNVERIFIED_CONTAM: DENN domain-containing protein 5B [Sesamum indicum]
MFIENFRNPLLVSFDSNSQHTHYLAAILLRRQALCISTEFVQKPPVSCRVSSPLSQKHSGYSRFVASATRCYCLLTRLPFFELHYEMLNSIIAQEHLNRITQFVNETALADYVPSQSMPKNHVNGTIDSPYGESDTDWMVSEIPVNGSVALTSAATGVMSDEEIPSSIWEPFSPVSATISDASDRSQMRELDKDGSTNMHAFDDYISENSEKRSNSLDQTKRIQNNGDTSDVGPCIIARNSSVETLRSFENSFRSARSMTSEEEDDDFFYNHDKDPSDEIGVEWSRENKADLLQIVCGYHSTSLPARGSKIIFQPLEHLQPIEYQRPPVCALGLCDEFLDLELKDPKEVSQVKLKLAAAEEALSLSIWSTATICRVLSLESVLALVTGILLEKQVVVLCPNLGVLSAVVLSLIPIIRPFEWQSLFLPILPGKMLDFLDAPVPYIVGVQHKLADHQMKTSNLVQVNVIKDKVKTCNLPQLPQRRELISELRPIHAALSCKGSNSQRYPVYKCNEAQAEAASQFLIVMRQYLESLCSDLRSHTITSVQSNNDRVSILLKDSFIDSFPAEDQPFVKSYERNAFKYFDCKGFHNAAPFLTLAVILAFQAMRMNTIEDLVSPP